MNRDRFSKIVLITALFVIILQITAMVFHYPLIAICYTYEDKISQSSSRLPIFFGIILGFILTKECSTLKKIIYTLITLSLYAIILI